MRCGGRATGRGAVLGLRGPGGARPPRHATTAAAASAVFAQLALRWGRNWAAPPLARSQMKSPHRTARLMEQLRTPKAYKIIT